MKRLFITISIVALVINTSCMKKKETSKEKLDTNKDLFEKGTFGYDKAFLLKQYKNTIELKNEEGTSSVIVSPELQGRVMTSTLGGDAGVSFGWLNYDLINSKEIKEHFNPIGGEERFWLGPEGGQFSLYFAPEKSFEFENWYVPKSIDTEAFNIIEKTKRSVAFQKEINLINYSGTKFDIDVQRKINLLTEKQIIESLQLPDCEFLSVAYETSNIVKNVGDQDWKEESGLISIWLLSMMTPSPEVTVVVPIKEGLVADKGVKVNDEYFGKVTSDRLIATEETVYFKADGMSRGKIGISSRRSTSFIGSYDAQSEVLTILQISEPKADDKYVNSAWELQEDPYSGDVLNSYNDGPLEDGSQMGPFYELESSSPALALKVNESYTHNQRMYHFKGSRKNLDILSKSILGISIDDIVKVFFN